MGAAEQSSADGSCLFGAPLDHGEGAGLWSQARYTCSPGREAERATCGGKRCRDPEGKTHPQISPGLEIECRERRGSTDARYQETITCSGCIQLTGELSPISRYGLPMGLIVFPVKEIDQLFDIGIHQVNA